VAKAISEGSYPKPKTREDFFLNGFFKPLDEAADTEECIQRKFIAKMIPVDNIRFISDVPGKNKSFLLGGKGNATREIQATLKTAEHSVIIQSPYLVLSRTARNLFMKLRKTSPELNIIISTNSFGSTDNPVAYSANYRLRPVYIQQLKFTIYEYKPIPADLPAVFPAYEQLAALAALKQEGPPFLCIHSKALVVDDSIAFIGSYNMDPRSGNLNTEVGMLIEDEEVATLLKKQILNDCGPGNSWVIAKKRLPLQLDKLNAITEGISGLSPVDIWPLRNTSSFDLIPGKMPLPPDDPDFYTHYRDTGSFPDMKNDSHMKQIVTRIYKAVGGIATPLF
jgi:phosphatidylserine/phosphatidylglycerophosphate/cardiolipin synthase-like enzyme